MSIDKKLQQVATQYKTAKDLLLIKTPSKNSNQIEVVGPVNEIQKELINVYQQILNISNIGIMHDFLKIGGNSLKAVYLVSAIYKTFHVELSLVDVFRNSVIADLALLIAQKQPKAENDLLPLEAQEYYLASHSQKQIWILDHSDKRHITYNMPDAFKIQGEIDIQAIEKSFFKLIELHESLRTTFLVIEGELRQKINENQFQLDVIDLTKTQQGNQLAHELLLSEIKTPFDLSKGPLIRAKLIQIQYGEYLMILNLHHIISDGWSMNILIDHFFKFYTTYKEGILPNLKPLNIQYKDYVHWYNSILNLQKSKAAKEYWINKLSGELPKLNLTTKPRLKKIVFDGNTLSFELNKQLTSNISSYCLIQGVTIFVFLQTIFNILLSKISGQNDIIIGTPVSGRIHKHLEDQIGLYINNIILRNIIDESLTFTQLLHEIKNNTLDAFEHQPYPYDLLIEDVYHQFEEGRNPFYDIMIVLDTNEGANYHNHLKIIQERVKIDSYDTINPTSKLDITFFIRVEALLQIRVEYKTNLFDQDQIQVMMSVFIDLVTNALNDPNQSVTSIKDSLMSDEEKRRYTALETALNQEFNQDF